MKKKYSFGLFVFIAVIIYLLSFTIYGNSETQKTPADSEELVSTDGNTRKEECYYLFEENGYVVVYKADKYTPYEYTDILYEDLPKLLREEIRNGKYIADTEELYGFLENYSS